jgi:chromosome segregation ATPase
VRDFEFVLNDKRTCYTLDDFKSSEARKQCSDWLQKSKNLTTLNEQLQQMRETSPTSTQQIINLEARIRELQVEVHTLEKQIRTLEMVK